MYGSNSLSVTLIRHIWCSTFQVFQRPVDCFFSCLFQGQILHRNKWFQITFSCPFNITINYDLWRFGFLSFFVSSFFPPPSTETSEEPLVDLSDVLNTDADILGMLGKPSSDSGAFIYLTGSHSGRNLLINHLAVGFKEKSFPPWNFLRQQVYFAFHHLIFFI